MSLSKKVFLYFKDSKRAIVPCYDAEKNLLARRRLDFLKRNCKSIPKCYLKNWNSVKLYSPNAEPENASAILIDKDLGAFDINNSLNELTGKEWTKFTCSWFIFNALSSDLKQEKELNLSTEEHPATFSPTMVSDFIKFFTKTGEVVIDPFAGIGSTLEACKRTGRVGYGIELNKKYYDVIMKRFPEFAKNIYNFDSTKIDLLDLPNIDFSISSPPYWDVLNRSTDGFKKKREKNGLDVTYSDANDDLGNIGDYEAFLAKACEVYEKLFKFMRKGAYLVIIVKNVKKNGILYPLAWDMALKLGKLYTLKDEKIWIQDKIGLSPYGYPKAWSSNILHHYCLILRKE